MIIAAGVNHPVVKIVFELVEDVLVFEKVAKVSVEPLRLPEVYALLLVFALMMFGKVSVLGIIDLIEAAEGKTKLVDVTAFDVCIRFYRRLRGVRPTHLTPAELEFLPLDSSF